MPLSEPTHGRKCHKQLHGRNAKRSALELGKAGCDVGSVPSSCVTVGELFTFSDLPYWTCNTDRVITEPNLSADIGNPSTVETEAGGGHFSCVPGQPELYRQTAPDSKKWQ